MDYFLSRFQAVEQNYGVNPLIFALLYLISIVPCWFLLLRIIGAVRIKNKVGVVKNLCVFSLFFFAPYAYIYLFGKNYPFWFHIIFWLTIIAFFYTIFKKIRKKAADKDKLDI
jgi:predicted membrane protein